MKYKITGYARVEVATIVEAKTEEEAETIAKDREVFYCIHGMDDSDGYVDEDWVIKDSSDLVNDIQIIEEVE